MDISAEKDVSKWNVIPRRDIGNNNNCYTSITPISLKSQAQRRNKNKINWCNHKPGQPKVVTGAWSCLKVMVEKQFQTNMFKMLFRKVAVVSEDLLVTGSWFQVVGAAIAKACLLIVSLVLTTKRCFETHDLRVLGI